MIKKDYSIIIGGAAGQGSRKAGLIIAKIFNCLGYNIFISEDYQSLIKGGHNFSVIRASQNNNSAICKYADFLLALDENTINKHEKSLKKDGLLIFNKDKIKKEGGVGIKADCAIKELCGIPIMCNIALIAGFSKSVGIEWKILENVLRREIK
ncbi:MAG: 2-oxoacid:acceptor oxidoreductase family protein [Candidatus Paceibacterota bacterium]|jgi:2-oxoglutarate ferredoxin oxidoreductase subunit alpha